MNRFTLVFLSGCTVLGLLFFVVPEIDLRVAALFYTPAKGFLLEGDPAAKLVQPMLAWLIGSFVTICLALLAINNMSRLHSLKTKIPFRVFNWSVIYLLLALALGPGLVINGILKDHWGRARPREVVAFGGDKQFTKAFVLSDQCETNCSFVSGEAALGFYGLTFMFVVRRRRRKTIAIASVLIGSLIGLLRMSLGAHFLSDVIFSGLFTFLVSYLLYLLLIRPPRSLIRNQTTTVQVQNLYQKVA
jgi:lipid A 4'-phosphatase